GYLSPMVCSIRGKEIRAWQAILAGSMLSALVEVIQLITWLGMLDVDDWVFNTVGTAAGYLLYRLFFSAESKNIKQHRCNFNTIFIFQQERGISALLSSGKDGFQCQIFPTP